MTEYISREEMRDALLRQNLSWEDWHKADYAVVCAPAADVRPVVLCRDCKHRDPEDHKCDCGQLERAGCVFPVDDDYYCAYGVKREES